jgi:hypothetical protein
VSSESLSAISEEKDPRRKDFDYKLGWIKSNKRHRNENEVGYTGVSHGYLYTARQAL